MVNETITYFWCITSNNISVEQNSTLCYLSVEKNGIFPKFFPKIADKDEGNSIFISKKVNFYFFVDKKCYLRHKSFRFFFFFWITKKKNKMEGHRSSCTFSRSCTLSRGVYNREVKHKQIIVKKKHHWKWLSETMWGDISEPLRKEEIIDWSWMEIGKINRRWYGDNCKVLCNYLKDGEKR